MKKNIFENNKEIFKYTLFLFAFILLYGFIIINHFQPFQVDANGYTAYLVDYKLGFCMAFLPGAVYHLFFKEVIPWQLNIVLTVLLFLFTFCVAFVLAKILVKQEKLQTRNKLLFLVLFLLSGPSFFSALTGEFGIYDQYWLYFALAFVVLVSKKYLRLIVPVFFVLSIMIHYSSVLSFIVFFAIVLWYEAAKREGKEKGIYIALLIVSIAAALAMFLYFWQHHYSNLTYSLEDFRAEIARRNHFGEGTEKVNMDYLEGEFYRVTPFDDGGRLFEDFAAHPWIDVQTTALPQGLAEMINGIGFYFISCFYYVSTNLAKFVSSFMMFELITLPLTVFFYRYWIFKLRRSKKSKKLVYILCMLQFPFTLIGCVLATDLVKWMMYAYLVQFLLFLYICYRENEFDDALQRGFLQADNKVLALYYCCYALLYQTPYTS
ncbi:MAG: hypothetical protein E7517_04480 [Ruminococcaceae bacterium]|nr:hypothetical protein [Oscillospiraceae bacterium]